MSAKRAAQVKIRSLQPGDLGWVIGRHGVLYALDKGWDERFEAHVAEIAAAFVLHQNPRRERAWIAELDGRQVGSVFLVRRSRHMAQLRLLIVEPTARGRGIGKRLVSECVQFARQAGYRSIMLLTHHSLLPARGIYAQQGFRLVKRLTRAPHGDERWSLALSTTPTKAGRR
jgi:predicted N-acetyltransferase YhbS